MADINYQRLTRVRSKFGISMATRSSLWLGPDHLLYVETTGYTESYKRFYFRDIQTITVHNSSAYALINGIFGFLFGISLVLMAIGGLFGELAKGDGGAIAVFCLIFFVFGLPLVLNNIFGKSCSCVLRTAVQTQELSSISRWRKARKVFDRVRPLIVAAQGEISSGEVSAQLRGTDPAEAGTPAATSEATASPAPEAPSKPPIMS
jgi:hypothetical protein